MKPSWDLILTTEGVVALEHKKIKHSSIYQHITFLGRKEMKIGAGSYSKDFLNMGKVIDLIGELAGKQESNTNDLLDIIDANMLGTSLVKASGTHRRPRQSITSSLQNKKRTSTPKKNGFFGKKINN